MKKSGYVIAFVGYDGNVKGVSIQKNISEGVKGGDIRTMFAYNFVIDYAVIWKRNCAAITNSEQKIIARCMREAVTVGWTHVSVKIPDMRGGIFGRKYVPSNTCMVIQWDGMRLPPMVKRWADFANLCRAQTDIIIKNGMPGPDHMDLNSLEVLESRCVRRDYIIRRFK